MVSSAHIRHIEWTQCVPCLHVTLLLNYDSEKRHLFWFTSSINKFLPPTTACLPALIPRPEKTFDFVLQNVHAAIQDDFSYRGVQSAFHSPPPPVMLIPSELAFMHTSVLWAALLVDDNPTLVFVHFVIGCLNPAASLWGEKRLRCCVPSSRPTLKCWFCSVGWLLINWWASLTLGLFMSFYHPYLVRGFFKCVLILSFNPLY